MADNITKYGLDASQAISEADKLADAFEKLAKNMAQSFQKVTQNFGADGKLISTTINSIVGKLGQLTTNIDAVTKEQVNKLKLLPTAYTAAGEAAARYTNQLLKLSQQASKTILAPDPSKYGATTNPQITKLVADADNIKNLIDKSKTLSKQSAQIILTDLTRGQLVPQGQLVGDTLKLSQAYVNLEKDARGLTNIPKYLKDVITYTTLANTATSNFYKSLIPSSKQGVGSPAEILGVQKAGAGLTGAIEASGLQPKQLEKVFTQLGAGDFKNIIPQASGIADAFLRVQNSIRQVGVESGKASNALQDLTRGRKEDLDKYSSAIRNFYEKRQGAPVAFGAPLGKVENLNEAYNAQLLRTGAVAQAIKASPADISKSFSAALTGINPFKDGLGSLTQEFIKLIGSARDFGNETEKAALKGEAALEKENAIISKFFANQARKATTQAAFPKAFADVQALTADKKGFGPVPADASVQQINKIGIAYANLARILVSGKITVKEFNTEVANIGSKAILPPSHDPGVNQLRTGLVQLSTSLEQVEKRTGIFAGALISLGDAGRIFTRLQFYRIFSEINQLFAEGIRNATEFGIKISLIRTITQDVDAPTAAWARSLREVSDELGRPLTEVASAAYNALSNQITRGKEDTEAFLRIALTFGRTVGTDATQAVDLLSTAIKGFGVDVTETEHIASVFFGSIDYGRVTAEGLNAVLARSAPLARDLGVSLEEVSAAISALTLAGFNAQEAGTRVANVLLAFEKPSKGLKEFTKGFGVDTGKELIQIKGFGEVLKLIADAAASGNVEFAELFPEIRKFQGAVGLAGDGAKTYSQILDDLKNGVERYKKATEITEEPFAKKFQEQITQIQNYITVDLVARLQEAFIKLSNNIGGIANAFKVIGDIVLKIIPVIGSFYISSLATKGINIVLNGIIASWAALETQIALTGRTWTTVKASFVAGSSIGYSGIATAFTIGFTAAILAMDHLKNKLFTTIEEIEKKSKIKFDLNTEEFTRGISGITGSLKTNTDEWVRIIQERSAKITLILNKQAEKQKDTFDRLKIHTDATFESSVGILEEGVSKLDRASKQASNFALEAKKNIYDIQYQQGREFFDRRIEDAKSRFSQSGGQGTGQEEINLTLQRVQALRGEATKLSAAFAKDPLKGDQLVHVLDEARDLLKSIYSPDLSSISRYNLELSINQLYKDRLQIINDQIIAQSKNSIDLEKRKKDAVEEIAIIKDLYKKFSETTLIDKEGKFVKPTIQGGKEARSSIENAQDILDRSGKLANEIVDRIGKVADNLGVEPIAGLQQFIGIKGNLQETIKDLGKQLEAYRRGTVAVAKAPEELQRKDREVTLGVETGKEAVKRYQEEKNQIVIIKKEINDTFSRVDATLKNLSGAGVKNLDTLLTPAIKYLKGAEVDPKRLQSILNYLQRVQAQIEKHPEDIGGSTSPYGEGTRRFQGGQLVGATEAIVGRDKETGLPQVEETTNVLQRLITDLSSIQTLTPQLNDAFNAFRAADEAVKRFAVDFNLPAAIDVTGSQFIVLSKNLETNIPLVDASLKAFINSVQSATLQLRGITGQGESKPGIITPAGQQLLNQQPTITPAGQQLLNQQKATGGMITSYYQRGGPSGTDTIPAWLSPGEYVVPAAQTKKYINILNRMRIGNFARGGLVNYFAEGTVDAAGHTPNPYEEQDYQRDLANAIKKAKYGDFVNLEQLYLIGESLGKDISQIKPYLAKDTSFRLMHGFQGGGLVPNFQSGGMVNFDTYASPKLQSSYYKEGGTVSHNNANFGDIHVNLHGDTKDPNIGRQIAQEIRREIRKGTVKFN